MDNLGIIESVSDFLVKTEGVHYHSKDENRFFCRGQGSMELKLRPKIGRYAYTTPALESPEPQWLRNFNLMFSQFEREYVTHHPSILTRRIDRVSLAQHYGLATQLLDWTLNPLIALFFSCLSHTKENGIVFFFMPGTSTSLTCDADMIKDINWQAFRPIRIDQRMINQDTAFTYHRDPTVDFAEELGKSISGVVVSASAKQMILLQLASIGIHKAFVYPGLTSICERIDTTYREKYSCEENIAFFREGAFPNEKLCADEREAYLSLSATGTK